MGNIVIASQLDERFNGVIRERARRVGDIDIVNIARGVPGVLPPEANILVAAPMVVRGEVAPQEPTPGWPFGLRWVQLASAGIDFYPAWLFDGPTVTTARGTAAKSIAEFVVASILAAAKQLPEIYIDKASDWEFRELQPVSGSVVGIFGFGAIGQAVAKLALAFGARVLALRRSDTQIELQGVEFATDMAELLARSNHVVLAAPSTPATRHVVNRSTLAGAHGVHLINVARGALIDDDALIEALDEGRVSLASLDVTEPEPLPTGHRYYSHPRVRLSPHTSAFSSMTIDALADKFVRNFTSHLNGAAFEDVVDVVRGY